jgi:hypothetical protein
MELGTYLVPRRVWNPIDFQDQRSPGQIFRWGDMLRFVLPLFDFELTHSMYSHTLTYVLQDVQAGLNFASEDEAIKFKNAVEQKLLEKQLKKMGKIYV